MHFLQCHADLRCRPVELKVAACCEVDQDALGAERFDGEAIAEHEVVGHGQGHPERSAAGIRRIETNPAEDSCSTTANTSRSITSAFASYRRRRISHASRRVVFASISDHKAA